MDNEIKMMLNAILEEIAHVDERVNKRFDKVEAQLDSLQHEVNACKLERESIGLLIKKIDQLESRIEELVQHCSNSGSSRNCVSEYRQSGSGGKGHAGCVPSRLCSRAL